MENVTKINADLDWPTWIIRWDRMQERYLVDRDERFAIIARLIADTQDARPLILDLGCGTGSLMAALLEVIPGAQAIGVDFDPTLLLLAEKRLAKFGNRASVVVADLREPSWVNALFPWERPGIGANAVVSATALHWLSPEKLSTLYTQIVQLLHAGGIFLNADHVASDSPAVQASWVRHREGVRSTRVDPTSDDWDGFWQAYLVALGTEAQAARQQALGDWQGVEDGMSLAWHFHHLRQAGFTSVDCFWRCDCDAIYGGVLRNTLAR
jgi:SAM-dependent methyltransferase